MMTKRNEIHRAQVELWEKQNFQNLSPEQRAEIFGKAFELIFQRTLKTLSYVTLQVILDRVFFQSREKFSLLSDVKIEPTGFNFDLLIQNIKSYNSEIVSEAQAHLLVEFLGIVGSLTADILTVPLHEELHKLTSQRFLEEQPQTLRQINSGRKTEKA